MDDNIIQILACSGAGGALATSRSIAYGFYFAAATGYITIWLFRLRAPTGRDWPAYWSLLFLILHPAWTVSAHHGDCGMMKTITSLIVFVLVSAFLMFQKPNKSEMATPRKPSD
jgi:hypothetical protein